MIDETKTVGDIRQVDAGRRPRTRLNIVVDRETVFRLAVQHRLPVSSIRETAAQGGVIGYGTNTIDLFRRGSSFVDRILRGAKVSELPVEFPTKFELAINMKTAKAIGLAIPESFLLGANEVIE